MAPKRRTGHWGWSARPPPSGGEVDHTTAITNPKVRAWNTTRTKGRLVLDAALARWARADVNQLVEAPGLGI